MRISAVPTRNAACRMPTISQRTGRMGKATGGGAAGLSPLPGRTHQTGAWPPAPGCSSSPGPWGGPAGGAQGPRHRRPGVKGLRASRRGSAARRPAWCSRCLRVHHPLNPLKWHASQASVQHWPWPWPCAAHAPRSTPRERAICVPAHIFSARPLPRHTIHNSAKTLTHTHTHTHQSPPGPHQVGGEHHTCAVANQLLDGGQRGADAGIVRDGQGLLVLRQRPGLRRAGERTRRGS